MRGINSKSKKKQSKNHVERTCGGGAGISSESRDLQKANLGSLLNVHAEFQLDVAEESRKVETSKRHTNFNFLGQFHLFKVPQKAVKSAGLPF